MKKIAVIASEPMCANNLYLQISSDSERECVMVVKSVLEFMEELQIQEELGFYPRIDEIMLNPADYERVTPIIMRSFLRKFAHLINP